ncbi:bile acid:sodium symporter [Caulobacter sp. CCUG 60055]|nr:bile acid:sodium symporter [Caulobacter sp. CCUG 60055]
MVVLASLLPARGEAAVGLGWATKLAIALLFFLHGAKLSREAVIAGIAHWRLHLTVLASTFVLFPILGLGVMLLPETILPRQLALGVLFLCCLPSTVQSSIAFTAIARGNVAAAVCAASASNLFGIALTPLLAAMLMGTQGGFAPSAVEGVVVQLLAPFVAGQVARPWVGRWVDKHKRLTGLVDRGSILLVVYTAFSEAVVGGLWRKVDLVEIVILLIVCAALLAVVLAVTAYGSRLMGFDKEDEITIVFCGSKKSLASGVPLAGILFPGAAAGVMVLPLMLFHQIQLMACAVIAQRYAARAKAG